MITEMVIAMIITGEAANQGHHGMLAVGCVLRNRHYQTQGLCASKRKDLQIFYYKQPLKVQKDALNIAHFLLKGGKDITLGATHFENVKRFGIPYWVKDMDETIRIKDHVFYKKKK